MKKQTPRTNITVKIFNREVYEKMMYHTAKKHAEDCNFKCLSCNNEPCKKFIAEKAGLKNVTFTP